MSWTFQDIRKFQYSKKNVLASDETEMDTFHKKTTLTLLLVKKVITSLEVLEPVPSMN